jgi:hypothetical protein
MMRPRSTIHTMCRFDGRALLPRDAFLTVSSKQSILFVKNSQPSTIYLSQCKRISNAENIFYRCKLNSSELAFIYKYWGGSSLNVRWEEIYWSITRSVMKYRFKKEKKKPNLINTQKGIKRKGLPWKLPRGRMIVQGKSDREHSIESAEPC